MDYLDKYDRLIELLTEEIILNDKKYNLKEDFEKFFINGNKTAGSRVRKVMQELKKVANEVRNDVQDYKSKI
jgi:hypothetical protein